MKKTILIIAGIIAMQFVGIAQDASYTKQIEANVSKLDNAQSIGDYQVLENNFSRLADLKKTDWLSYYYAAFCNAKISWMYQEDADKIEPYSNLAEEQIKKAQSLLDTATNKLELSEVYCVISMVYRAKVFISPMANGKKYGPVAHQYIDKAAQSNPDNPRSTYLHAWEKYYTPKLWGGDKNKAKELLELALRQLGNKPSSSIYPRWGKTECEDILKLYN
jgi:hypothetical protein